jgi:hypothetical protein
MKVKEQFEIAEPVPVLWEFFEQVDRVARCVPGVEDVTVVDADNSKVRVTQSVGPMSATFDLKMRITNRDPGRSGAASRAPPATCAQPTRWSSRTAATGRRACRSTATWRSAACSGRSAARSSPSRPAP